MSCMGSVQQICKMFHLGCQVRVNLHLKRFQMDYFNKFNKAPIYFELTRLLGPVKKDDRWKILKFLS